MKKWGLIAVVIFSFSTVYGDRPEKQETLVAKVILQNTNGYFVLSDGSLWKAIGFCKRWRTVGEWWNDAQLVPKNYECLPNDWFLGTEVWAYSKYENLQVDEDDASNKEVLKQCTHLLVNNRTGQVLFAIALNPADCVVHLFNEAHDEGYSQGYTQGQLKNSQNAHEMYNKGHADGYKTGYIEGYQIGLKEDRVRG